MTPRQELLIENIITELALEISQIQQDRKHRQLIDAHLERIERCLAVPLNYSIAQAARRLGFSVRWAYDHLNESPKPVSTDPLRFSIADIEAFALGRGEVAPRNAPRRRRQAARKGDAA